MLSQPLSFLRSSLVAPTRQALSQSRAARNALGPVYHHNSNGSRSFTMLTEDERPATASSPPSLSTKATSTRALRSPARRKPKLDETGLSAKPPSDVRILVTGASGQIGTELIPALRARYGPQNVIATDVKPEPVRSAAAGGLVLDGPYEQLDVLHEVQLKALVQRHNVNYIIHLASLLSAVGERNPQLAMKLNVRGIENVLELARQREGTRVFAPSTIAAFGPTTPRDKTPDLTIMRPTTIYGVTKVYLELLGEYYTRKFGVDFRSVRYPGIISPGPPGGGTTDYACEIFHEALKVEAGVKTDPYVCFLKSPTALPMMYMPDAVEATIQLLEAPAEQLTQRVYNIQGFSFTPSKLYKAIQKRIPQLQIKYKPDFRQAIADSWPSSLDDSAARRDWHYKPKYDMDRMVDTMLQALRPDYTPSALAKQQAEREKQAAMTTTVNVSQSS